MKYCPKCLDSRLGGENYCWKCGAELVVKPPLVCKECGGVLSRVDRFCPNCGVKVKVVDC